MQKFAASVRFWYGNVALGLQLTQQLALQMLLGPPVLAVTFLPSVWSRVRHTFFAALCALLQNPPFHLAVSGEVSGDVVLSSLNASTRYVELLVLAVDFDQCELGLLVFWVCHSYQKAVLHLVAEDAGRVAMAVHSKDIVQE